jgi:RNA polymerase primary sigma factor
MSRSDEQDGSLMAYAQYMRQVSRTPRLTDEEEAQLVQRIEQGKRECTQSHPDERILEDARQARDRLVLGLQRLVLFIAGRWQSRFRSMELLDLVQEGTIGLLQMIEHYDLSMARPLDALAAACIRHAISRLLRDRDGMVRLPGNVSEALARLRWVEGQLALVLGREPTIDEIAHKMQLRPCQVRDLVMASQQRQVESLQTLLGDEDAEERHDFAQLFQQAEAAEVSRQEALEVAVQQALDTVLTERQRQVVTLYYGLAGHACQTQKRIAESFGVSEPAIRSAEQRAKRWLRVALAPVCGMTQDEASA